MNNLETIKEQYFKNHEERMKTLNKVISEIDKTFSGTDSNDYHENIQRNLKAIDEMLKKMEGH